METSTKKTRSTVVEAASNKPLEELLRVCKPLSVKMTRLPMSVVVKHTASGSAAEMKTKTRRNRSRQPKWMHGYRRRKKRNWEICRRQMLELRISKAAAKNKKIEEQTPNPDRISASKILNSNDLDEESSAEKEAVGEVGNQTARDETQSETHGSGLPSSANEAPSVMELNENISALSADTIGECLRRSIVRDTGKRKRPSRSSDAEAEESNRFLQDSKKSKSLDDGVLPCDDKASSGERKTNEIVAKRVKPVKIKKHNPKSVRRRVNNSREARIFLRRLEDSLDPLIRQWNEKRRLFSEAGATTSTARRLEKHIDDTSRLATTDELSRQESSKGKTSGLPTINVADLDVSDSSNATPVTITCAVPASTNVTSLGEGTKTSGLSTAFDEATDDENDEEIMEFLRSPRKVIPLIDSSSSDTMSYYEETRKTPSVRKITRSHTVIGTNAGSISDSEEMATIRSLSRNAKTPSIIRSSPERRRPETRMSRMLRLANISAMDGTDLESSRDNHSETPKSPRTRSQDLRKTPSLRLSLTRNSMDSEASISVIERPLVRQKSSRLVIDDTSSESTYNPGEALTDMFDDDVPSPMPTQNEATDASTEKTNRARNPDIGEDKNEVEAMTEVNCDASPVDDLSDSLNTPFNQRNDVLTARKKLTALNAMVVLTRLEDLDDISEGNRYSETEMELRTAEDSEWPRDRSSGTTANLTSGDSPRVDMNSNDSQTPDPLDINREDDRSLPSETITPFAAVFCRTFGKLGSNEVVPTRSSPRKLPRVDYFPNEEVDARWSQDTVESDVELSLILEESERTRENSIDRSQTSGIGDSSVNSLCASSEGILNPANGNGDTPCQVHGDEDLDDHSERSPSDEAQRDEQSLTGQNIAATHKCVNCNGLFKNAELLEQHHASSAGCKPNLRCSTCQTTCKTPSELTKHRTSCAEKISEKRKSIEETTSNEADTDNNQAVPENYASVWLLSKTDPKKSQGHKKVSKRARKNTSRVRGDNPICNVCSKNFGTTQALSEHIYKHSPEELQEAYRVCKAKLMADFETTRTALVTNGDGASSGNDVDSTGAVVDGAANTEKGCTTHASRGTGVVTGVDRDALAATVCPCHRQSQVNTEENDLQIEMVLVCQHCQVLFRRRECFEVHYRTSPLCANDRTRGRWPRLFCASCQLTLNSWADMRHHLEVHASVNAEGTVRFVCNICRVVFVGFGALFYYHWFSHLKDTMLVASRHSFPKISVQPIDGLAKLPIGASPDESYIWVAEHVCADCKKPFSTRRDLELHRETDSCIKIVNVEIRKDPTDANDSQWYCDVCEIVFADRDQLNDHGVNQHGRHYTCVSTSPKQKTFMCTKCCAMRKRVKDIEEHWKSHPQHNLCHFEMENRPITANPDDDDVAVISPLAKANEVVENLPSTRENGGSRDSPSDDSATITKNGTSSEESRGGEAEAAKTSAEKADAAPGIDIVFQAAVENPGSQSTAGRASEKSPTAGPPTVVSAKKSESMILCNLLSGAPSTARYIDRQKTRIGALEDPCVNVVMSDSSNEKLSASLVIDESYDKTRGDTIADSHTESYQILMMDSNPKSNSGPIKMVFGRKGTGNSVDKIQQPRTSESKKEKMLSSKSTSIGEPGVKEIAKKSSLKKTTVIGSTDGKASKTTSKKRNDDSSRKPKGGVAKLSLPVSSKNQGEPEIIDIVEEIDVTEEGIRGPTNENKSSKVPSTKTKLKSSIRSKKSSVIKLHEGVESMKINSVKGQSGSKKKSLSNNTLGSQMITSLNDSGKSDNSDAASLARREPKLSFEEARYAAQLLSKNASADDAAVAKKQGFLRVKNLAELQAVRQHVCPVCSATFESHDSLNEHKQLHFPNLVGNVVGKNPKGMTAALVLPDASERPKTPIVVPSKNVTRTLSQSYISQRYAALTPAPSTNAAGVVGSTDSWIYNANNQNSPISNSLTLNVTNGLGTILSKLNMNTDATKTVITSTAGISQPQQNFVVQSQPSNTIIGYVAVPDVNRQLPEARNPGQIGYHVLPAMVAPSAQGNRQHTAVASQQNSSSNNLPTSGLAVVAPLTPQQVQGPNKFVCTICRTFRCDSLNALNEHINKHLVGFNNSSTPQNTTQPSISTVIVPQASSFATVNQVVSNTIADNTTIGTKTTSERLVVNNWILSNPTSLWTTSNFNQQSGSSVLPITTQSLLSSTVQNSNGNGTNPSKSSPAWPATACNQPVQSSADGIVKESLASPIPQNPNNNNNNNNGTGASKQSPACPVTTFNGTGDANGGQIVYQCMICKSSMYTDHEHLRRHVLIVHGVENFLKCRIENAPKSYFCNRCPNGTAPFDSQSKLRTHQETDHSNACPSCHRNFYSYIFLNDHMEHCRTSNTHANFDSNC